ncbi:MAG: ATP-binding protein [Vicinamibacterales bacterium]|nr:ATP-binding protein [Vicinamibacterales bacterium]
MFSIRQKQILGVTSLVAMVVVGLSVIHVTTLARVALIESRARGELLASAVYHRAYEVVTARDTAYASLRQDPGVRAILASAIYGQNVTFAAIVDPQGFIVAHSDPARVGERLPDSGDLEVLLSAGWLAPLREVYRGDGRTLEHRAPMLLGDEAFGEIRVGVSTLLVREEMDEALAPALGTAVIALIVAVAGALVLARVVLRPIHVISSGLTRLGRGELGVTLDLREAGVPELGSVFDAVSAQLRALPAQSEARRAQLVAMSQRVAALGRLTAGVAHEVKNPLNAMTIHLELVRQKLAQGAASEAITAHLDVIGTEIARLDEVIQGFLKFARPEDLQLGPVDIGGLVGEVFKMVRPEADAAGVALRASADPDLPPVEADAGMLRQALFNLAVNAVQAMPEGGRFEVQSRVAHDGRVEVRLTDTGAGMTPEQLGRVFDLYYTTKPRGSGIGLSMVFRTIQLHQGEITVESVPRAGTTFTVTLPVAG